MTDERKELATRIVDGLAGYFQFVHASRLLDMPGEDTAQFLMCQVLQAQQDYRVTVSDSPPNWTGGQRVDAGLLGRSSAAQGWYGVVEVKWITSSVQRETARCSILEDCARVASVVTGNLNAKLVVVGFTDDMVGEVFDTPHPKSNSTEAQRILFADLLKRAVGQSNSKSDAELRAAFPDYQSRVPANARFTTGLAVELLAEACIKSGAIFVGHVFAWQVNQRQGRPPGAGALVPGSTE